VPLPEQVAVLYAGTQGHLDKVPVPRVREWEAGFVRFLKSERPGILEEIDKQKALDDNLFARLIAAISPFNHQFGVEGYQDQPDPASAPAAAPKAK
jgi:F-type H+-transporting ATPase subunit alpha